MLIGVFITSFFVARKAKTFNIQFEKILIVITATIGCALVGGSALYIFVTYSPAQIWEFISNLDFSFIEKSGIVFYGGLIAGLLASIISVKILKIDIHSMEKSTVPYIPLGHAIGRVGCLFAGCCHGFEYDGFLAVRNILISPYKTFFPVQLMEAVLDIVIVFILLAYGKKERKRFALLSLYLFLYAVMRFGTEFLRADAIRGSLLMFSTSQWISIGIVLLLAINKLVSKIRKY